MSTITYAMDPVDNFCGRYILNEAGEPVPELDLLKWGAWVGEDDNLRVEQTTLPDGRVVSTIFLGLDHRHGGDGAPILFETMLFSGAWKALELLGRYATRHDALVGHSTLVESLRQNPPPS